MGSPIRSLKELGDAIRKGPYAWPGGYPIYFITADGGALSFETVKNEFDLIADAIKRKDNTGGWRVVGADINWEDTELIDDHTGEPIESAHGDDDEDEEEEEEEDDEDEDEEEEEEDEDEE